MDELMPKLEAAEQQVMRSLTDFQRATVNRIDQLYRKGQRRVLVCDEVGLGKTLVARGTVAKLAKLRREEGDDLFKVVYICSNAAIAGQNLQKLGVFSDTQMESTNSSRLSMQHLNIFREESQAHQRKSFLQLIPMTPDTSFRQTSGTGIVQERALMYAHLRRMPELGDVLPELEVAMTDGAPSEWRKWARDEYERQAVECDRDSGGAYFRYMQEQLHQMLSEVWDEAAGKTRLEALYAHCMDVRRNGGARVEDTRIISRLRSDFARISLNRLEPDLVIMDEFQRFRDLLHPRDGSDTKKLTQHFFRRKNLRMLLLSATPYKLYATPEEIDEAGVDEHFQEFRDVMSFLFEDTFKGEAFEQVWRNYSSQLKELRVGDSTLLMAKRNAEDALYQAVCRTERLSERDSTDLIDDTGAKVPLEIQESDVRSFVQMQQLLEEIGVGAQVPVDYVKSAPYLLSFMKEYQLKKRIERELSRHPSKLSKADKSALWLDRECMDCYEAVPSNNARLERVMKTVLQQGTELLLWLPPSMPYYPLEGVFRGRERETKTLIFSSWEMVPRMLSCLLSYEAERRTVGALAQKKREDEASYFQKRGKRYPPERLQFSVKEGKPSAMALTSLLYPSRFLSKCYDPIACMNEHLSLEEIQARVREQIARALEQFPAPGQGTEDRSWYYLAPMLLDERSDAERWLEQVRRTGQEKDTDSQAFRAHLATLEQRYQKSQHTGCTNMGKRPEDLIDVLTDLALASPAVCVLRTYQSYGEPEPELPTQMARVFLGRMNTPESTAVVELSCGSERAHWRSLLTYCKSGGIQAVLDEYAHLLTNGLEEETLIPQLHKRMTDGLKLRTTTYNVDTFPDFQMRMQGTSERETNLRTHFAVAFTKGRETESDSNRKTTVRNAFNSPFRPFVLATTSIGQEGLDFHNYCRRIVHWNLPSNPIDLEQREGRINRYQCLAIRQNVAQRYGTMLFRSKVWEELFKAAARAEKTIDSSDLIPNWALRNGENEVKIERIVPMYPFSRDGIAYERLMKILSLYRLTLGQARQEELLEYLLENCEKEDRLQELFLDLSPFSREKRYADQRVD